MTTGQTVFLRKPLPPNIIYAFLVAAPAVVTTKSINVPSPQTPTPHCCPHQSRMGSACPNLSSSFSSSQTQQFSHRMSMKETQLTVKHWQMASQKFGLNWENTVHHFYLTIYVQIWNDAYIATCHEKKKMCWRNTNRRLVGVSSLRTFQKPEFYIRWACRGSQTCFHLYCHLMAEARGWIYKSQLSWQGWFLSQESPVHKPGWDIQQRPKWCNLVSQVSLICSAKTQRIVIQNPRLHKHQLVSGDLMVMILLHIRVGWYSP